MVGYRATTSAPYDERGDGRTTRGATMQKSARIALIASVLVVALGALGFWWFVLRDDAPERASLPVRTEDTAPSADDGGPDTIDGTWAVVPGEEVFAGYRIQELFGGETVKKTAVGRTPGVSGSMTVSGTTIEAVTVTADLTRLESDSDRRDGTQQTGGLEIQQFPEATFTLTEPLDLGTVPEPGTPVEVTATGELTLHGVTRPVQLNLQANWSGSVIDVAGGTQIVLADYAIEPPDTAFVSVDDVGEFEVQLAFERS
jgi:polyisoprenoid-binding protein YceI